MSTTDVDEFIAKVTPALRLRDARTLLGLYARATGEKAYLWGTIVGYGTYHYKYASDREGDSQQRDSPHARPP